MGAQEEVFHYVVDPSKISQSSLFLPVVCDLIERKGNELWPNVMNAREDNRQPYQRLAVFAGYPLGTQRARGASDFV
jgi:hypothetical protein